MEIRLSGIYHESLVNGSGMRRVFFAQGCKHNCKGCFNPETHDFSGGKLYDIDTLVSSTKANPILRGITFSGGDPFEQVDAFSELATKLSYLNIWCYTGYTVEYLIDNPKYHKLLSKIDVLVDGKFEIEKRDETLKFRGSSNQRIIKIYRKIPDKNNLKILKL